MKALKITTLVFLTFLMGLVALALLQSDPLGGEPVYIVQLKDGSSAQLQQDLQQAPQTNDKVVVNSQNTANQDKTAQKADPAAVVALNKDKENPAKTDQKQMPALPKPGEDPAEKRSPSQEEQAITRRMVPVPVTALVEFTQFGALPKVSEDGKKAADVYARPFNLPARPSPGEPARIAIVITGIGLSASETHSTIHRLPGAVTLAFEPYGQSLQSWVKQARDLGHEVVLQIPLEPFDYPDNDPGPHTLRTNLAPDDNLKRLQWLMARFTGYAGVMNSRGSKFLTTAAALRPVLQELNRRGLYYFEDGDTTRSVTSSLAKDIGLSHGTANLILDQDQTKEDIDTKLQELEKVAGEQGMAIGVGTTLPLTIDRIESWAKTLEKKGIILIPLSAAVRSNHRS